jgi:hypothetical protein
VQQHGMSRRHSMLGASVTACADFGNDVRAPRHMPLFYLCTPPFPIPGTSVTPAFQRVPPTVCGSVSLPVPHAYRCWPPRSLHGFQLDPRRTAGLCRGSALEGFGLYRMWRGLVSGLIALCGSVSFLLRLCLSCAV